MANASPLAIRTIVNADGSIDPQHKWLCTSPIHYRNILEGVAMRYLSDPGARFVHESVPLSEVQVALYKRGF
jgi:hypothetical protein